MCRPSVRLFIINIWTSYDYVVRKKAQECICHALIPSIFVVGYAQKIISGCLPRAHLSINLHNNTRKNCLCDAVVTWLHGLGHISTQPIPEASFDLPLV